MFRILKLLIPIVGILLLISCSGGGGDSGNQPQTYFSITGQTVNNEDIITLDQPISFTFDKSVLSSSAENLLFSENGISIPIQTTVQDNTLLITTAAGLRYSQTYELDISMLTAIDNSKLEGNTTVKFYSANRNDKFFTGGVIIDGVIDALYDDKWSVDFLLSSLTSYGVENFRLGTTTAINERLEVEPVDNWSQVWETSYWSSREFNAYILQNASQNSTNNSIFLFLSSGATHAGTYATNNEWDDLSKEDLLVAIEQHARETAQYFIDKGIFIKQYEIGNEIDFGIAGYSVGNDGILENIDIFNESNLDLVKESLWIHHIDILKAGIRGIKSVRPDAKIAVHLAAAGYSDNNSYPVNFYKYLIEKNIDFEIIGISYPYLTFKQENLPRPYFKSNEFNSLMRNLSALGKKIQISEFSYNYDEDSVVNTPSPDYPVTPQGQADFIRDFLNHMASYPRVTGAYYFYPDYYKDMNNYAASSIGLFASPSELQPGLDEIFKFTNQF